MRLFGFQIEKDNFELNILGFRIGWSLECGQNCNDYAIMFHIGFLNPGITLMLSWRR